MSCDICRGEIEAADKQVRGMVTNGDAYVTTIRPGIFHATCFWRVADGGWRRIAAERVS